jgi:hypothetical protein
VPEAVAVAVALPRPNPNVWVHRFRREGWEGEEAEAGLRQESRQSRVMEAARATARRGPCQVVGDGLMAVVHCRHVEEGGEGGWGLCLEKGTCLRYVLAHGGMPQPIFAHV